MGKGIRWLAAGILAVALAGVIAWALFVPAADWLARHDIGAATGTSLETARANARGGLLTLSAGLVAAAALVFTARNLTLSRRTFELTEQGQVTDRYTKAIEQLGSDKIDVRIGGIYALERVARDSARDHPTIMEVLAAFIREHSREPWPVPNSEAEVTQHSTRPDVQAAVAVVGRRATGRDSRPVDLKGANLTGADLTDANLTKARLSGVDLTGANLARANLSRADLTGANLSGASLTFADLNFADLTGALLTETRLLHANLALANLTGANLSGASLTFADLFGADWPDAAPVPEGWLRDGTSRRLARIQTPNSGKQA